MQTIPSYVRDLLLIGGGHAHVQVLRQFGMQPEPGVRLTLVSRESLTPYTGMLPGYIAGDYSESDITIDLLRLSNFAQCRLIVGSVEYVDQINQVAILDSNRPPLRFDVLSINTGGVNSLDIPGSEFIYPVKPIGQFLSYWNELAHHIASTIDSEVAIVGGGPGSVELAIALRQAQLGTSSIHLLTQSTEPMSNHGSQVREHVSRVLSENQVSVTPDFELASVEQLEADRFGLTAKDGRNCEATHILSVTGVSAPEWIARSNFEVDEIGCLAINRYLQSISNPYVFGAGDVVSMTDNPRSKSGVYAVRQGPYLAQNVRNLLIDKPLKKYKPQKRALALLRTSSDTAIASRGSIQNHGHLAWRYKDWIDKRFMNRFNVLPTMETKEPKYRGSMQVEAPEQAMRCGGCGAKLGADKLNRVLHRLNIHNPVDVHSGIGEDAAVVHFNSPTIALSCDGFRKMIDDTWLFGRISAHHALNDLYAMGSQPTIAVALVTIPLMSDNLMEDELFQVMSGALSVFEECNVSLVGGHTAEGAELSIGFTVVGEVASTLLTKSNLRPGDVLILNKPLGLGAILAGGADGRCSAASVETAIAVMDQSNQAAMNVIEQYGATACTDVTGFGFAGHLGEMLRGSAITATISLKDVPILEDAEQAIQNDVESSLQLNNEQVLSDCEYSCSSLDPRLRLLADPQTSGGLLAAVSRSEAEHCVEALRQAGYTYTNIVGAVNEGDFEQRYIKII